MNNVRRLSANYFSVNNLWWNRSYIGKPVIHHLMRDMIIGLSLIANNRSWRRTNTPILSRSDFEAIYALIINEIMIDVKK